MWWWLTHFCWKHNKTTTEFIEMDINARVVRIDEVTACSRCGHVFKSERME